MAAGAESIVLGGGCFWCTEAVFQMFKGIVSTEPGYAGGKTPNPTYEKLFGDETGHAEVLMVKYDPEIMSLEKLLKIFFEMHDPTSLDRQGADMGPEYRSMILYTSDEQKGVIESSIKDAQRGFSKPIVTEVRKLEKFYPAEDYHKGYYNKNPDQPYCSIVIAPKVEKIKREFGLS